ncbi:MFS transporter [Streptomyces hyderabadensis]|uniref:Major facilitator superfamily (MFS) profile domain-containing protein n=1 Tax=Streptomyces hyderabadensis TaxID=598549 RepID=A0ABP9IPK5_9ACTN|nr:MFS transporter [Streptomyces hyderabadensis]
MAAAPPADQAKEPIFTVPFVSLMMANGFLRVGTYMLVTLMPLYALDRGVSTTTASLTVTFYMLAAVLVRPVSGRLVDTRGRYVVMVCGSVLYCATTGLYALSLPVWLLLLVRALQGVGFSLNGTAVMTLATDLIPESRMSEGIGYLGVEQTVAQLFAPWLAFAVKDTYGYRTAFLVVFALSAANVLARLPLKFADKGPLPGPPPASAAAGTPWWGRIVEKNAWRPALVMFFVMTGATSVNTFMAAHTADHGISNPGPFFTASALTLALARLTAGRTQRRFGTAWTIAPGIVLVAVALLLVFWSPNLPVLMAGGACYGLGMGTAQPGINALAVLAADRAQRGLANSTFFMAMDLSQAVGAVALGALAGLTGIGMVFLASSGVLVATAVAYLTLRSRGFVE